MFRNLSARVTLQRLGMCLGMLIAAPATAMAYDLSEPVNVINMRPAKYFAAGIGGSFGTEIERPGVTGSFYYSLDHVVPRLRIGGDATLFFPRTEESSSLGTTSKVGLWWLEFNTNAQFTFFAQRELHVYGMAGLNLAFLRTSIESTGAIVFDESDTDLKIGLNIGGGLEYVMSFAVLYAELRFVVSNADQVVLGGGLRWDFEM